ncbi:MAG: flavodoxin family protein [Patescibacteria group bacterium]
MNILLIYATNSGSTAEAANIIADVLTGKGHAVSVKNATTVTPEDVLAAPFFILGSPSWNHDDLEGQPLPEMEEFIARCKDIKLNGKPCAVFGLGDSSYTYFCGAVTYLEAFIKRAKGTLIVPSLKVDGFYMKPGASENITKWAKEVAEKMDPRLRGDDNL